MPIETVEEASKAIKMWMEDRGVFTEEVSTETAHFQYEGTWENGVSFSIVQPKDMKRIVGVVSKCEIEPQYPTALDSLNSHERQEFLWDIKETLLLVPIFTIFMPDDNPKSILFVKEIAFDELTEGRLAQAVDQVSRMIMWLSLVFLRRFGEPMEG
jgi:hypothetical protein